MKHCTLNAQTFHLAQQHTMSALASTPFTGSTTPCTACPVPVQLHADPPLGILSSMSIVHAPHGKTLYSPVQWLHESTGPAEGSGLAC